MERLPEMNALTILRNLPQGQSLRVDVDVLSEQVLETRTYWSVKRKAWSIGNCDLRMDAFYGIFFAWCETCLKSNYDDT